MKRNVMDDLRRAYRQMKDRWGDALEPATVDDLLADWDGRLSLAEQVVEVQQRFGIDTCKQTMANIHARRRAQNEEVAA